MGVIHLTDQLLLAADGNGIRREGEVTALEAFGHAAVKGALNRISLLLQQETVKSMVLGLV